MMPIVAVPQAGLPTQGQTGPLLPYLQAPQTNPYAAPFAAGSGGAMPSQPGYPGGGIGGPYQNFIPQAQPANYNPGGGFMPAPIGGYWNQMAQQMAGPMYGPAGVSAMMGMRNPMAAMNSSPITAQGASSMLAKPPQAPTPSLTPGNLGALSTLFGINPNALASMPPSAMASFGGGSPSFGMGASPAFMRP